MEHNHLQMYTFYQQLGMDFADEQDQLRKNRSQKFHFGLITEDCARSPDSVALEIGFYTPYGSRQFSEQYPWEVSGKDYLHQHDYYELMYVCSGTVNVNIDAVLYQYHTADAVLINRFSRHLELYDQNSSVVFLCLSKELAQELLVDLRYYRIPNELTNFLYQNTEQEDIYTQDHLEFRHTAGTADPSAELLFSQLIGEMETLKPGYMYMIKALLLRFFHLLSDAGTYVVHARDKEGSTQDRIFEAVRNYIVANRGMICRKQLEQALHFHGDYLNKVVKARTGTSLLQFAQSYRMKEAARLLDSTGMSVGLISQTLGFTNKTHFYRLFHDTYHMTPAEYRRFSQNHR